MKYIIEINDTPYEGNDGLLLYRARIFKSLVFDEEGLRKMEKADDAMRKNYDCGLEDAYYAMRRILAPKGSGDHITTEELEMWFGITDSSFVFQKFSIKDVMEKLEKIDKARAEKEKQEEELERYLRKQLIELSAKHGEEKVDSILKKWLTELHF